MSKPLFKELAWLLLAVAITTALEVIIFGWNFFTSTREVMIFDTYYIITGGSVLLPLFSLICFLLFFFKEIRHRFSRNIPSFITIVSGILLIAMISLITITTPITQGFTIYPPLSALTDENDVNIDKAIDMDRLTKLMIVIQAMVGMVTAYVAYKLGTAKSRKA